MRADEIAEYHLARLLILLSYFGRPNSSGLHGLTKLAKLDFLLRYPSFTEKLLPDRNANWPLGCAPSDDEREAVESQMIRYKYGPWDDRYYPLVGRLVGCGLAETLRTRGQVAIRLTEHGTLMADGLARSEDWHVLAGRCEMLSKRFNLSGNRLKSLINESLPKAADRSELGDD